MEWFVTKYFYPTHHLIGECTTKAFLLSDV